MTTIGVLGAGQLGRMLALAGYPLGLRFRFLDPLPDAPAGQIAEQVIAEYDDLDALRRFADGVDVITYEFENVPMETALWLEQFAPVFPTPGALHAAQDRLHEKALFRELNIPTPSFAPVNSRAELEAAIANIRLPAVLKTRRFGYDGKAQAVLRAANDVDAAWPELGGAPLMLEGFVPFEREVSVIAASGRDGATVFYSLVENEHRDGILRVSMAPCSSPILQAIAEDYASRVLAALNYVGVLAIEFFDCNGQLLANEMAPRVHNSGHWTIQGAETSQFENHLRAILGWPLGLTAMRGHAAMVNLIGELPDVEKVLAIPGAHLHVYGKAPRAGRKLGHITLYMDDLQLLTERLDSVRSLI
ncbi:MAG: 5-(carboxyamino)imidazole ribonucleotide synthase [Anaerolineales bacterium]